MSRLLDRVKARIEDRSSPIRTVRGLAETIGMSEAGFYRMVKRENIKKGSMLAIANALNVTPAYFEEIVSIANTNAIDYSTNESDSNTHFGEATLQKIMHDMHEMRQIFEEQLRAKDRQIERLLDLLGKPEGAIIDGPLSTTAFDAMMNTYRSSFFGRFGNTSLFLAPSVAKLVAPRSRK